MTSDRLTFANFNMLGSTRADIYEIGAEGSRPGVIREIAQVFGHHLTPEPEVANLGFLIETVGPETVLQQNISHVQKIMGSEPAAMYLAQDWVRRSGLLTPVKRAFMNPDLALPQRIAMAIVFGGSGPSMDKSVRALKGLSRQGHVVGFNLLAGGNRPLTPQEGKGDLHGKAEYDYLKMLSKTLGSTAMTLEVDSSVGMLVAESVARNVNLEMYVRHAAQQGAVAVISSAGAWVQRAGQLRRAMNELFPQRKFDENGDQLFVATDTSELTAAGDESFIAGLNPFRALGQIVRNAQELAYTLPR